jgi:ornithine carbamoyltransferase
LQKKYEEKCKQNKIEFHNDIFFSSVTKDILSNADAVLTDTWESMGENVEPKDLIELQNYRVTQDLMDITPSECLFMHCLPANRTQEVEAQVIDGPSSRVWQEAENRLHIQKQILIECFN